MAYPIEQAINDFVRTADAPDEAPGVTVQNGFSDDLDLEQLVGVYRLLLRFGGADAVHQSSHGVSCRPRHRSSSADEPGLGRAVECREPSAPLILYR